MHYKNVIFSNDLYQISNKVNKLLLIPFFLSVNLLIIKMNINITTRYILLHIIFFNSSSSLGNEIQSIRFSGVISTGNRYTD